jgi:hypothetical protein
MQHAILTRTFALDGGPRVQLRLARLSDLAAVRALLERRGVGATDLDLRRLLAYDPWRRAVLCAFAPLGGVPTLVGLGAIDLRADAEVDTLVVDDRVAAGLGPLLGEVLEHRAQAHARRVA